MTFAWEMVDGADSNHPRLIDEVEELLPVDVAVEVFEEDVDPSGRGRPVTGAVRSDPRLNRGLS
jgi:hypothetical protein